MATKKLLKRPRPKFTVGLISTPGTVLNQTKLLIQVLHVWFENSFLTKSDAGEVSTTISIVTVLNYQTNIHTSRFLFPIFSSQFKFFKLTSVSNYTRYAPNLHITHLRKKIWLTKVPTPHQSPSEWTGISSAFIPERSSFPPFFSSGYCLLWVRRLDFIIY